MVYYDELAEKTRETLNYKKPPLPVTEPRPKITTTNTNLKVLNKDFRLKKVYDRNNRDIGKFDRDLQGGDWVRVDGIESYHNGVIMSIMTIPGELKHNPLYGPSFGNKSWYLLKDLNNDINRVRKDEYTREVLEKMHRTENVEKIITTHDPRGLDPDKMVTNFTLKTITDEKVEITVNEGGL